MIFKPSKLIPFTGSVVKKENAMLINLSLNKTVEVAICKEYLGHIFKVLYRNPSPNNNKTCQALWLLSEVITTWISFSA